MSDEEGADIERDEVVSDEESLQDQIAAEAEEEEPKEAGVVLFSSLSMSQPSLGCNRGRKTS